jgi:hypothetical protein
LQVEARHVSEANIAKSYHDVKLLAADERLLLAQALWAKVDAFLESRGRAELGALEDCLPFMDGLKKRGTHTGHDSNINKILNQSTHRSHQIKSNPTHKTGPNARAVKEAVGRPGARRHLRDLQRRVAICHEAFRCVYIWFRIVDGRPGLPWGGGGGFARNQ